LIRATEMARPLYVSCVMACLLLTSCMETMAPSPPSRLVSIVPLTAFAPITKSAVSSRFQVSFHLTRLTDTTVYLGLSYEIEKLVDQKWQRAYVRTIPWSTGATPVPGGRGQDRTVIVDYTPGVSEPSLLLEHMRGLYRARFTLSYTVDGATRLLASEEYTPPFAVSE